MDILGPFLKAKGQIKFLLIGVDYFTKWIEAEPLAKITTQKVQHLVWQHIICRYGILNSVVTDNDTKFVSKNLHVFYKHLHITHKLNIPRRMTKSKLPTRSSYVNSNDASTKQKGCRSNTCPASYEPIITPHNLPLGKPIINSRTEPTP
ncbi:Pol polyprotein, partial [Mucuna pruriens]